MSKNLKNKALAKHLGLKLKDLDESVMQDYSVMTDDEANDATREYILGSVWAFRPEFLAQHSDIDVEVFEAIQANGKCEDNNDAIMKLINNVDSFIDDAIDSDGRGHFITSYDGKENEVTVYNKTFYIYRMN